MRIVEAFPRKIRAVESTWITLSDGCRLAARIWLPEDAERDPVPAILEYIPYRKRDYMRGRGTHSPHRNPNAYPMTDETEYPSAVSVTMNGRAAGRFELPDDPADHRGILSCHAQLRDRRLREAGSYGYLLEVPVRAFFSAPPEDANRPEGVHEAPWPSVVALVITALATVALFIRPGTFYDLMTQVVAR